MLLRLLLFFQIFYTVYELHFQFTTGIPGINLVNLIFLATLFAIMISKPDTVRARPILRGALLLFFAVLVLAFINAQSSKPPVDSDDVTYLKNAIFYPLLYFVYLRCRQDLKTTRWLIIFVLAVAAIAGVQAIRQGLDYGFGTFVETHRASGPFGTTFAMANRAGVYYAMFLPMFLGLALMMRTQMRWRVAALMGIGILALAILFTYSRQSYFIALLAAALLFARRHLVLAAIMAIAFIGMIDYLPDSVTERVAETRQENRVGGDQYDVSTASRWKIWHGAMGMLEDNPQGVGLNRFQTRIGAYTPEYANYDAHNFYVLTVCECGVLGLAALLWLIFRMFSLAAMLRRNAVDDESRALAIGFTVAVLCVGFGNLYGSPFLEGSVMGDFWILCGLLERYGRLKEIQSADSSSTPRAKSLIPQVRVTALPLKDRRPVQV
jgi:hypothetical protein